MRSGRITAAAIAVAGLATACAPTEQAAVDGVTGTAVVTHGTIDIDDNEGVKTVPFAPERVAALDDRARELLAALGVEPQSPDSSADLMVATTAEGSSGHRPEGAYVDLSPREGIPLDWEMVRQVQVLGQILGTEEEAARLDDQFSEARERALEAREKAWTFAAVTADQPELTVQPPTGDALWEPVFTMLELKPALTPDKAVDVQSLREVQPTFLLVSEHGIEPGDAAYVAPMRWLATAPEFDELKAVQKGNVYVPPLNTQDNASIVTYMKIFNELADQWSALD